MPQKAVVSFIINRRHSVDESAILAFEQIEVLDKNCESILELLNLGKP
jgi:hypothetical protein